MAALTRRGWDEILDEVLLRSGGKNYSGWSARVQQFISAAYYDICSLYRHIELEATNGAVLDAGDYYFALASFSPDVYHVHVLYESVNNGGISPLKMLSRKDTAGIVMAWSSTDGQPEAYSLRGSSGDYIVVFDREADIERSYVVIYQSKPTRPDFATTDAPEIGPHWDEHLIELALAKIGVATGDQQMASVNAALYKDFVSQVAQPLIDKTIGASTPEAATSNKMSTGKLP